MIVKRAFDFGAALVRKFGKAWRQLGELVVGGHGNVAVAVGQRRPGRGDWSGKDSKAARRANSPADCGFCQSTRRPPKKGKKVCKGGY